MTAADIYLGQKFRQNEKTYQLVCADELIPYPRSVEWVSHPEYRVRPAKSDHTICGTMAQKMDIPAGYFFWMEVYTGP